MKLWEGNIFKSVCLSTGGGRVGISGTRSLLGVGIPDTKSFLGEEWVCPRVGMSRDGYVHGVGMPRGWVCPGRVGISMGVGYPGVDTTLDIDT